MNRTLVFLLFLLTPVLATHAAIVPSPPQISAKAYLLIDAASGEVLAEKNADQPLPPASLTKLMTSYVLAQEMAEGRVMATDMVTISENAWSQNPIFKGSSLMWIEPGKDVSIADLELGVIVSSGNDATVAVAEHVAGSESVFVDMMNANAERLGMVDTYYVNSHGLPDPNHVTTSRDLAKLAKALIVDYPENYALYKEREFTYNGIRQYNRNTLMAEDSTVDGLKTGHTQEAGYCLVASAERRDMRLISVVMGTSSKSARKNATRALLNYGFRFFDTDTVYAPMTELDTPRVWKGQQDTVAVGLMDETILTLPRGKHKKLVTSVSIDDQLVAPLATGDEVGTVTLTLDGETVFHAPVVALVPVERGSFFVRLWDAFLMWFAGLFQV